MYSYWVLLSGLGYCQAVRNFHCDGWEKNPKSVSLSLIRKVAAKDTLSPTFALPPLLASDSNKYFTLLCHSHSLVARPCANAHLVRSAVFRNPYFLWRWSRCFSTVLTLIPRNLPTRSLVNPLAISPATSRSRGDAGLWFSGANNFWMRFFIL